ncbi:hypothetical protein EDC94DRAFT_582327 [Helicostylum pulchrum]|nr:hypothetical protein EDC94DRAFT_582327 [Helicostylum pulchrum]
MYRFHSEALRFKSNNVTELDSLMKIWGGTLEPLFPDKNYRGESMSEHNLFKIDCRIIFFYDEKLVDLTNMEAASKDILDYLIKNSNNFDHTRFCVPMIQICNNQCVVLKLYLADNGLYCVDEFVNLTIPLNPAEFAAQSSQWFQKLFSLRSHVFKLLHLLEDTN